MGDPHSTVMPMCSMDVLPSCPEYSRKAEFLKAQKNRHSSFCHRTGALATPATTLHMLVRLLSTAANVGRAAGSCAMQARIRRASCGGVPSGGCNARFSTATAWITWGMRQSDAC